MKTFFQVGCCPTQSPSAICESPILPGLLLTNLIVLFFQDVSKTIGAPFSVFLSQYPFLPIGRAKNGCPVNYFLAGKINPEGILSLSTPERLQGYFWWSFMYKFKQEIRKAQERDPDFVRVEGINILDLQGLSASALSSETIDVVKLASKISDFFPEVRRLESVVCRDCLWDLAWTLFLIFWHA
jgi:hypothetical protein